MATIDKFNINGTNYDLRDNSKVAIQQGSGNAGKALVVGADGNVTTGDAGIPDTVKVSLLDLLRHVAYIDNQGQNYYNALYAALYSGGEYTPKYKYTYSSGDLRKLEAGVTFNDKTNIVVIDLRSFRAPYRRAFLLPYDGSNEIALHKSQVETMAVNDDGVYEPLSYPIPVPNDATSVTVKVTPSSQYIEISALAYDDTSSSEYTRLDVASWTQGTSTLALQPNITPWITVVTKYDNSGTTYPTEPTELIIEFEK